MHGYGKSRGKKTSGVQNMAKLGGPRRKLSLKSDMRSETMPHGSIKKALKSGPHKGV